MNKYKLLQANIAWLHDQIPRMKFGEAAIRIIVHDGRIQRVEKSIVEKEQAE